MDLPLVIIGPTIAIARNWARANVRAHSRQPVCISLETLDALRGMRALTIICLPEVPMLPEIDIVSGRNTIVRIPDHG